MISCRVPQYKRFPRAQGSGFGPVDVALWLRGLNVPSSFSGYFALATVCTMLNAIAPTLFLQYGAQSETSLFNPKLGVSKVVIACVIIALLKLRHCPQTSLRRSDIMFLLPAVLGTLAVSGTAAWAGLALSCALLLGYGSHSKETRVVLWIVLVAALHAPASTLLGQFAGGAILAIDQWATVNVLQIFGAVEQLSGNAIQRTGENALLLVWDCGIVKNTTLVLLLWMTMLSFGATEIGKIRLVDASLLVLFCFSANVLRLTLMASDELWFEFLHDGQGATLFRLALLCVAVACAGWRINNDAR